jgi:O-antigen/teichoic acid export membrane protein
VFVGQALAFSGGFVGIKVLTNMLGPAGYGKLALGMTIAGLLHMFVYGPIEQVVLRFVSVCSERQELGTLFSLIKSTHQFMGLLLLILIICATVLTDVAVGREWAVLVGVASLFGIVSGLNATFTSIQSALRQRKIVALHQGADVWLRLGLAAGALYLFHNTGYVALLGFLLGTLGVTASQLVFALRHQLVHASWNCAKSDNAAYERLRQECFDYGRPFILFGLFGIISSYADRWIILGFSGEEAVGGYAAMCQIANVPIVLVGSITNQLMVPVIFQRAGALTITSQASRSLKLLYQTVLLFASVILGCTALAYIWSESLVGLLTAPEFANYHNMVWVLMLALGLFQLGQLLTIKGFSHNQTSTYIFPKLLQALCFGAMAFMFVKSFGIVGVAWALCVSSIVYLVAVLAVNRGVRFLG